MLTAGSAADGAPAPQGAVTVVVNAAVPVCGRPSPVPGTCSTFWLALAVLGVLRSGPVRAAGTRTGGGLEGPIVRALGIVQAVVLNTCG
jgi:hypothetical protein